MRWAGKKVCRLCRSRGAGGRGKGDSRGSFLWDALASLFSKRSFSKLTIQRLFQQPTNKRRQRPGVRVVFGGLGACFHLMRDFPSVMTQVFFPRSSPKWQSGWLCSIYSPSKSLFTASSSRWTQLLVQTAIKPTPRLRDSRGQSAAPPAAPATWVQRGRPVLYRQIH